MLSIVLSTRDGSNKKESVSITYLNPEATNSQIIEFAQLLMGFSDNVLLNVNKVTKEEVYKNG